MRPDGPRQALFGTQLASQEDAFEVVQRVLMPSRVSFPPPSCEKKWHTAKRALRMTFRRHFTVVLTKSYKNDEKGKHNQQGT